MKQTINFYGFCDAFRACDRNDSFTYAGKKALYNYLTNYEEETGEELDLDIIALCCEYTEYNALADYLRDYDTDIKNKDYFTNGKLDQEAAGAAILKEIEDKSVLIPVAGGGFIILQY